jgi:post-segregation antitoxin (ccd killing protein)
MGKVDLSLRIDADLLRRAQAAGVDPAQLLEESLESALREPGLAEPPRQFRTDQSAEARAARWTAENGEAIEDYNRRIERRGVFGEEWRRW